MIRVLQQATYPDAMALNTVLAELTRCTPLVSHFEIITLRKQLARAVKGECFILQGGDCAESFADCKKDIITNKLRILLQMSVILIQGLNLPITRIGRIAGQYAKPRSNEFETIDGVTLPSYRGDLINGYGFTKEERTPDPKRLLTGYHKSLATLNYLRSLVTSGFASLYHPEHWLLDFAKDSIITQTYQHQVAGILKSLQFLKTIGAEPKTLSSVEFYTSHEALHLAYEQAFTQQHDDGHTYNLSCHFPWVGLRTASIDSAHIEYVKTIANPIAIKVGVKTSADELTALIRILNKDNIPGRLTLITRFGHNQVDDHLPRLIAAVQKTHSPILWTCDPMHGNTTTTKDGYKTRDFHDILAELQQSFAIHKAHKSHLGGVHFELTGENVTECTGGLSGVTQNDLSTAYKSLVDPRLNYEQSLEMALSIVEHAK